MRDKMLVVMTVVVLVGKREMMSVVMMVVVLVAWMASQSVELKVDLMGLLMVDWLVEKREWRKAVQLAGKWVAMMVQLKVE